MHTDDIEFHPGEHDPEGEPLTFYFHHNGDYSGDTWITVPNHRIETTDPNHMVIKIPTEILFEYVGRALTRRDINTMEEDTGLNRLGFDDTVKI